MEFKPPLYWGGKKSGFSFLRGPFLEKALDFVFLNPKTLWAAILKKRDRFGLLGNLGF